MDIESLKKLNSHVWEMADQFAELRKVIEESDFDEQTKEKLVEHFEYPEAGVPLNMWYSALNELWHRNLSDTAVRTFILSQGIEALEEVDDDEFNREWR